MIMGQEWLLEGQIGLEWPILAIRLLGVPQVTFLIAEIMKIGVKVSFWMQNRS